MAAPTIETIRPGVAFTPEAAASFRKAEAERGRPIDVNSSTRDWDEQQAMYDAWTAYQNGTGPHPGHSRAIPPDQSKHCQGLAVDSDDWTDPAFLDLMERHGWIRTAAWDATEQHHFEYQSWRDQHRTDPIPKEDDMSDKAERQIDDLWQHWRGGEEGRQTDGEQALMLRSLYNRIDELDRGLRQLADLWEHWRYGEKGVQEHGDGTADVLSRLGRIEGS